MVGGGCGCLQSCYTHDTRYKSLKIFHTIDSVTFILRFIVVCIDLSNTNLYQTNLSFSVVIFILECIASLPILLANVVYCFLLYFTESVSHEQRLRTYLYPRTLLRFSAMTCFACKCYYGHPSGMQLTRLTILVSCFAMRFIAFILGAVCATKYNPVCVPYAVLSSFFLIPSLVTVFIEMFHFHVLWNYQPSEILEQPGKGVRGFLKFLPYNMLFGERGKGYSSTDESDIGCQCDSASLSHTVLYHSSKILPKIPLPPLIDGKVIIAYYLTSEKDAIDISKFGFPLDRHKNVDEKIYFTLNAPLASAGSTPAVEGIIYVRLCLGHVLQVNEKGKFDFKKHPFKTPEPKALELMPDRHIKVKFPRQIENWIIVFPGDTKTTIHPSGYKGLL